MDTCGRLQRGHMTYERENKALIKDMNIHEYYYEKMDALCEATRKHTHTHTHRAVKWSMPNAYTNRLQNNQFINLYRTWCIEIPLFEATIWSR